MEVVLSPRRVARFLIAGTITCVVANVLMEVITRSLADKPDWLWLVFDKFNMDDEGNLPTWFSAVAMVWCAGLLRTIAVHTRRAGEPRSGQWNVIAILWLAMSIDEISAIHELPSDVVRNALHLHGLLWAGWVIPAIVLVVLVGVFFVGFLRALDPSTRRWLVLGGSVFLAGSIGLEMVSGALAESHGPNSLVYTVGALIEETTELIGVLLFGHGLMLHLAKRSAAVRFTRL